MKPLTLPEIRGAITQLAGWHRRGVSITRTFQFDDFVAAMKFVNRVARAAEKAQHHPDIIIQWNRVRLTLSTHDAGGLTMKDFALAAMCNRFKEAQGKITVPVWSKTHAASR
ncbi:MAG: 4a-hydroxytetrahydrobiopterin dehydratase [Pedosphaera sp.]|nr:4a-hydroxytetrahydrobiopterin dehydratase [Pedosphaera sp.]